MATTIRNLWSNSVRDQRKWLGKRHEQAEIALIFDDFEVQLEKKRLQYESQTAARCVSRLNPFFQQLNHFNKGITSVASSNEGSSVVWGVLMLLITAACDYAQMLDELTNVVQDLTSTVTRINRYLKLLPTNLRLQSLSVDIMDDYVKCCITALKFYETKAISNFAKFFWKGVLKNFKESRDKINSNIVSFEKELRVEIDEILVTHAKEHMPVANIPSTLFSVPYGENEFFCGREATLLEIDAFFSSRVNTQQPSCLLHAMGGMGKTQVALAYAHKRRGVYPYIFWLASERETELSISFSEISSKLNLPGSRNIGQGQKATLTRDWLETTDSPWLIIFDNIESMDAIRPYWPSTSQKGAILVTSQIASLAQFIRCHIPLQPLSDEEGASLLLDTLHLNSPSDSERKAAIAITKLVGGLPIAISHIAGSMFSSKLTLDEAMNMFREQKYSFLWSGEKGHSTHVYNQRLDTVWDIALGELNEREVHFLNVLSMLNPDAIQEDMLLGDEGIEIFGSDFPETLPRVRSDLARRQLVQRNASKAEFHLSLHRSLQLHLRGRLDGSQDRYATVFDEAVQLVRGVLPFQSKGMAVENHRWVQYDMYSPHVRALQAVVQASYKPIGKTMDFARLLSDSANYYWERNFLKLGVETCQLAVSIFESLQNPDPIAYSQPLTLWGLMAGEMGIQYRNQVFEPLLKCLNIRATYLENAPNGGDDDEQRLYGNAWGDLCCACIDAGYYDEVEKYANINLALKSRVSSEETHAMFFGSSYMHLAHAYAGQKRYVEAKAFVSRCRKMATTDYEPHTAAYQKFVYFEACILKETGDLLQALGIHEAALEERLDLFGPFENNTRYSYYAIGEIHHMLGDLDAAEAALRRSLESLDRASWLDLGAVARSRYRLAKVLQEQSPQNHSRASEAKELEHLADRCRRELLPQPERIFEAHHVNPLSYFDLMVPFTARTRFLHDKVKQRQLDDQVKIPDRVAHLQHVPAYSHWDPEARNALVHHLNGSSLAK